MAKCIRGITLVTEKIKKFVFGDITERITKFALEVEELLVEVNAYNEYVVQGLVNHDKIPLLNDEENGTLDEEREEIFTFFWMLLSLG